MKNVFNNEEDNSNNEINEFTASIINYKLKANLSTLFTILENKLYKQKLEYFTYIKNFTKTEQINNINISSEKINDKLKMYLVYHNIQKNCNNLYRLYNFFRFKKKCKVFSEWKNKIAMEKSTTKIELELKEKYNKLYKPQISNINSSIKKSEKGIEDLKSQEKKITQNIKSKEKQRD